MYHTILYTSYKIDKLAYYILLLLLLLLYQFIIAPSTHFHMYIIISHVCWLHFVHTYIFTIYYVYVFMKIRDDKYTCMYIIIIYIYTCFASVGARSQGLRHRGRPSTAAPCARDRFIRRIGRDTAW